MRIAAIWYKPEADVEFTWTEVESLILLSERHYDHKCKELSQQYVHKCKELSQQYVGVLYGMRNMFEFQGKGATITYRLDGSTADLLCKCAEADPALFGRLLPIFRALNDEWRRINKANL
jgi:hypothetical protein